MTLSSTGWPLRSFAFASACGLASACGEPLAIVDVQWTFVDGSHPISNCGLNATEPAGNTALTYSLLPRLRLFACEDRNDVTACLKQAPVVERVFSCRAKRGSLVDVPAADEPYLIDVDVLIEITGQAPFAANARCVARPGPRWRKISGGNLVDLAVYQFVVDRSQTATDVLGCAQPASAVLRSEPLANPT